MFCCFASLKKILHPSTCITLTSHIPSLPFGPQNETLAWIWFHHFQEYFILSLHSYVLIDNISYCLQVFKHYINDTLNISQTIAFLAGIILLLFLLIQVSFVIILIFIQNVPLCTIIVNALIYTQPVNHLYDFYPYSFAFPECRINGFI